MTHTDTINVAIYVRHSSDEQAESCSQQLTKLHQEAERRGYRIVAEYKDEGRSGSREIAKRVAFHQMIADSAKGEFERVFVWDASRFGRLDSQAAAEFKSLLRKRGVGGLDSLREGYIDWSSSMGRVQDAMLSEAAHKYSLDLGENSLRGRVSRFQSGIYTHGMVPFGYDKEYTGNGTTIVIKREGKFTMPRGWTRKLIVNEQEATVVRRIFDLYVNRGLSVLQVMKTLQSEKVPGWYGKPWSWHSVDRVLTDPAYIGTASMGKSPYNTREAHRRAPSLEVPGVLPVIVDDDTWHAAQRQHRKAGFGNRSDKADRVLNGTLFCGHCGHRLVARQRKWKSGRLGPVFYSCSSNVRRADACPQRKCWEAEVLPVVVRELVRLVDQEVLNQLSADPGEGEADAIGPLQKQVDDLREKVRRAVMRAAVADDELLDEYQAVATGLKAELTKAEEALRLAKHVDSHGGPAVWSSWWAELRPGLVLRSDDPALLDELLEAQRRHPALRRIKGQGGWDEFKEKARTALVRLSRDGDSDPLKAILPELLDGESDGVLLDLASLRGALQRLGCQVSLYWRPNPDKTDKVRKWCLDRGQVKVSFEWHTAPTSSRCRRSGVSLVAVFRFPSR
jgi:DNA invertase Pin-like site-specific DNA recombinase